MANIHAHAAESGGIRDLLAGIPPSGFLLLRLFSFAGLSHISELHLTFPTLI